MSLAQSVHTHLARSHRVPFKKGQIPRTQKRCGRHIQAPQVVNITSQKHKILLSQLRTLYFSLQRQSKFLVSQRMRFCHGRVTFHMSSKNVTTFCAHCIDLDTILPMTLSKPSSKPMFSRTLCTACACGVGRPRDICTKFKRL